MSGRKRLSTETAWVADAKRPKFARTTEWDRARFIQLHAAGHTDRAIAKAEGFCQATVSAVIKKHLQGPQKPGPAKRGRPRIFNARDDRRVKISALSHGNETIVDVWQDLTGPTGLDVSQSTVGRAAKRVGLKSYTKQNKPFLTEKQRKARLRFCQSVKDMTSEDWRQVLFSDETKINCKGSDGKKKVLCVPQKRFDRRRVSGTLKFGGGSIMVWGCMSWHGFGRSCRVQGIMTGEIYKGILKNTMLPSAKDAFGTKKWVFMQDNDPKHTSGVCKKFLAEKKVTCLRWPSQSPDLNPIEHFWGRVKERLQRLGKARNPDHLWEMVQPFLADLRKGEELETIRNLIDTMPARIQKCIKERGRN
jgi:transposase